MATKSKPFTPDEVRECNEKFNQVIRELEKNYTVDPKQLKKAYDKAFTAHNGVRRKSGEPYIDHPLEVALILASHGFDEKMVIAGILHDVVEDTPITLEDIQNDFGKEIADMIDAVSSVDKELKNAKEYDKDDIDAMSDVKFLKKTLVNKKGFYIRLADRVTNLRTISVFPVEKQLAKAAHTRDILIPRAKLLNVYLMVDILESLCLKIEKPEAFEIVRKQYERLLEENDYTIKSLENFWSDLLEADGYYEDGKVWKLIFVKRYEDSIHRHLVKEADRPEDLEKRINKKNLPLLDINFIVSSKYKGNPMELFLQIYPKLHNSRFRMTVIGTEKTMRTDTVHYRIKDRYDNEYRLFIRTEQEWLSATRGLETEEVENLIQKPYIDESQPNEGQLKMITVFKKDGSRMEIEEGATALDLAFLIHEQIGICARYAVLNRTKGTHPLKTKLREGDVVEIVCDHNKEHPENDIPHAKIQWFEYLHNRTAIKKLSRWLEKHPSYLLETYGN